MTPQQVQDRLRAMFEHYGVGPSTIVGMEEFLQMVQDYDDLYPLTEEEAADFCKHTVAGLQRLEQKKKADLS